MCGSKFTGLPVNYKGEISGRLFVHIFVCHTRTHASWIKVKGTAPIYKQNHVITNIITDPVNYVKSSRLSSIRTDRFLSHMQHDQSFGVICIAHFVFSRILFSTYLLEPEVLDLGGRQAMLE